MVTVIICYNVTMKKIDYHMHTFFSHDSKGQPEEYIKEAINLGLDEICFTDHNDYIAGGKWILDVESYFKYLLPLKEKYQDQITIKIGIEVGLDMLSYDVTKTLVASYPFDFVIGSIHTINLIDIAHNEYYEHKTKDEVHELYFKTMLECVKQCDYFDVLGHLDYVRRNGPFVDKSIDYAKYQELIDEIYKLLIAKGKGIEINLSGYRVFDESLPNYDQVKRYYDLGGRIITIGTDSHQKEYVGKHLDKALKMCEAIGFKDITTFTKREVD